MTTVSLMVRCCRSVLLIKSQRALRTCAPDKGQEPDNLIIDIAKRLDAGRFPLSQFGIQFVQ